jgi:predicted amidohydrolase
MHSIAGLISEALSMEKPVKVAAIQLAARIADSAANIAGCERLAQEAVREGARWIALPEFFNTGVCWNPKLAAAIEPSNGAAASFLRDFSARYGVVLGGSFLCRLAEGGVRNRYLCYADGALVGRHDKDLPTMWENAFYEGGASEDDGVLGTYQNTRIGAAVCWEFMRTGTARRLRQRVDVIMAGSCWWSMPTNFPGFLQSLWEPGNSRNAIGAIQESARLVGAPVIHAAHCGDIACPMPGLPIPYRGFFEGHAAIVDANGRVIAHRHAEQGQGIVSAKIVLQAREATAQIPKRYWLCERGALAAFAWHQQRWLGRRWYLRHVRG